MAMRTATGYVPTSVSITGGTIDGVTIGGTTAAAVTATTLTSTGQASLIGSATNDNAAAGQYGEYVTASLAVASATALTTATAKTITSISLTAGDWDVTGMVDFKEGGTTSTTLLLFGTSTTNNTLGADDTYGAVVFVTAGSVTTNGDYRQSVPTVRYSLAAPTTIYLVAQANFTVSTMTAYGTIRARRMR